MADDITTLRIDREYWRRRAEVLEEEAAGRREALQVTTDEATAVVCDALRAVLTFTPEDLETVLGDARGAHSGALRVLDAIGRRMHAYGLLMKAGAIQPTEGPAPDA